MTGDSYLQFLGFHLLKCQLADSQHMQDHKAYYVGANGNATRRSLYRLWKRINDVKLKELRCRTRRVSLALDAYLLINSRSDPTAMSTQLTGNTCYFQTYLFAVLCKVGCPSVVSSGSSWIGDSSGNRVQLAHADKLAEATVAMSQFMLCFFVDGVTMRPLSNSNFVIDFYHYRDAAYFRLMTQYLRHLQLPVPEYEEQYVHTMAFFAQKTLHTYGRFSLSGAISRHVVDAQHKVAAARDGHRGRRV